MTVSGTWGPSLRNVLIKGARLPSPLSMGGGSRSSQGRGRGQSSVFSSKHDSDAWVNVQGKITGVIT